MTTTCPHREADETAKEKDCAKGITKIYPRGFNITWGNDDRYWNVTNPNVPGSVYMAELKQVSWLEVTCSTDAVDAGKNYRVGFNVTMRPDAFGWDGVDVYVMAKVGKKGKFKSIKVSLGDIKPNKKPITIPNEPFEILVNSTTPDESKTIHLGLYEVWSSKWKGGLQIHDAFIQKVDPN